MNTRRLFVASCLALLTTSMVFSIRGDIVDALSVDSTSLRSRWERSSARLSGASRSPSSSGDRSWTAGDAQPAPALQRGLRAGVLVIIVALRPAARWTRSSPAPAPPSRTPACSPSAVPGPGGGGINPHRHHPLERQDGQAQRPPRVVAGRLVAGGLIAFALTKALGSTLRACPAAATHGWQIKLAGDPPRGASGSILGQKFPATERSPPASPPASCSASRCGRCSCCGSRMWLTAATEQPDQWVSSVMSDIAHMQGVLIPAYTAGIMFVPAAGPLAHKLADGSAHWLLDPLRHRPVRAQQRDDTRPRLRGRHHLGVGKSYWPTMLGKCHLRALPAGGPPAHGHRGRGGNALRGLILRSWAAVPPGALPRSAAGPGCPSCSRSPFRAVPVLLAWGIQGHRDRRWPADGLRRSQARINRRR